MNRKMVVFKNYGTFKACIMEEEREGYWREKRSAQGATPEEAVQRLAGDLRNEIILLKVDLLLTKNEYKVEGELK